MSIIYLVILFFVLILVGIIFALPVLFPSFRQRARASQSVRYMMMSAFGLLLFLAIFLSMTKMQAVLTNTFSTAAYPYGYFMHNEGLNTQLERELWIQFSIPPFLLSETSCFNRDPVICDAAAELNYESAQSLSNYLYTALLGLIPALSCAFMVRYLTRDHRKQKQKIA